ncbi:PREDICTED: transcriptional regulator ATRX-like [Nanorana parkeri]|uniref:transcriptional regulator ATRX-like n=1 Tax=Nanorana parkeri TaxID=125878 RepID=UPI000854C35D|nr:PREDICTED: transcriptional regulator ATRX-like [Nanorana parkeri]
MNCNTNTVCITSRVQGLTNRLNTGVVAGINYAQINFGAAQSPYMPLNLGALSSLNNQQLEDLINQGREKVVEATNSIASARIQPLEDLIATARKDNPALTESQAQSLALSRQSSQELEIKRREAVYNDVLAKQQMLISCVQRILMGRRLQQQYNQQQQQQQLALQQQAALNRLIMQKSPNLLLNPANYPQIDMQGLYQNIQGHMQRAPPPIRAKSPGSSQGKKN